MIWNAVVIAFVVTVAVGDVLWRKVPRSFALLGFVAGVLFHAVRGMQPLVYERFIVNAARLLCASRN